MKAIMVNEDQSFGGYMSGMDSKRFRTNWEDIDNRMEEAKIWEYWNSIKDKLGTGGGGTDTDPVIERLNSIVGTVQVNDMLNSMWKSSFKTKNKTIEWTAAVFSSIDATTKSKKI